MVVGDLPMAAGSEPVKRYLNKLSKEVEETLEQRFIYFLVTRPRARFVPGSFRWEPFRKGFSVKVVMGAERKRARFHGHVDRRVWPWLKKPDVALTDRFITFKTSPDSMTWSVHDFLSEIGVAADLPSKVEYVGKTKQPDMRLASGRHEYLARITHRTSEGFDTFLLVHLFKVTVHAPAGPFFIVTTNPMTDQVNVEHEADIIECAFVRYFMTEYQRDGQGDELSKLRNRLQDLAQVHNIREVVFDLEMQEGLDSSPLFSAAVDSSRRHAFRCTLVDGEPRVDRLPEDFDPVNWAMNLGQS